MYPSFCILFFVFFFFSSPTNAATWKKIRTEGSYTPRGEVSFSRCGNSSMCLVGGRGDNLVNLLDTVSLSWSNGAFNSIEMHHFQGVRGPDSCVWVAGAWTGPFPNEDTVNNIWKYCPTGDVWKRGSEIPRPRGSGGAAFYRGKLYLVSGNVGGHNPDAKVVPWFDCYDPATNKWTTLPDVPNRTYSYPPIY